MALLARLLYDVQKLDLEIDAAERESQTLRGRFGETEDLRTARQASASREEERKNLAARLRSLELDLGEVEDKIKATEKALYQGEGQTPKELASLQKEDGFLRSRRGEIEEQALETMERLEEASRQAERLRQEYEKLEATWKKEQGGLQAELEKLKDQFQKLQDKRAKLVAGIHPDALDAYEELRKRKGRVAVALVEGGICKGCGVDVPPSQQNEILRGEHLVHCSNCERILYMETQ
ncbi:MAG: hypothetical protein HYX86_06830 [Chloroflexi bacterium]|nr:hypothetical protein [Chloroflexota bacterium]